MRKTNTLIFLSIVLKQTKAAVFSYNYSSNIASFYKRFFEVQKCPNIMQNNTN